jgi:hypothetical protein
MLHNRSFRRGYVYTLGALVGVLALTSGYKYFGTSHSVDVDQAWSSTELSASRKVLSSGGEIIPGFNGFCPDLKAWENDSGAILHVILVTYLFLGIAIICDEQFTSSLECICDSRTGLGLSPDVAGELRPPPSQPSSTAVAQCSPAPNEPSRTHFWVNPP